MRLASARCAAMGPHVRRRPVHRDTRAAGQLVFEGGIEDQLTRLCQPRHADPIVAGLLRAGQIKGRQLHKVVGRSNPAGLMVERREMRPGMSVEIRLQVQIEGAGDRGAIPRAVVTRGNEPNDPICIGDNGRRCTLNGGSRSQQLLDIQNDDPARVFALVVTIVNCVAGRPCALKSVARGTGHPA